MRVLRSIQSRVPGRLFSSTTGLLDSAEPATAVLGQTAPVAAAAKPCNNCLRVTPIFNQPVGISCRLKPALNAAGVGAAFTLRLRCELAL